MKGCGSRVRIRLAVTLCLGLAGGAVVFVYTNVRLSQGAIEESRLTPAIQAGLTHLDRTDELRRLVYDGGRWPVEMWIVKRILAHAPHDGLAEDVGVGWRAVLNSEMRVFTHLPGEPKPELTAADRRFLRNYLRKPWSSTVWDRWTLFARYPEFIDEFIGDFEHLLTDSIRNSYGYVLTHRILAFRIFQALNPDYAERFDMVAREKRATAAMYREMLLDFRVYDLYFERVAFLLETGRNPPQTHRWIERILADQGPDGGWAVGPSLGCEFMRFLSLDCDRGSSQVHPTFLALWALVQYREFNYPDIGQPEAQR